MKLRWRKTDWGWRARVGEFELHTDTFGCWAVDLKGNTLECGKANTPALARAAAKAYLADLIACAREVAG